MRTYELGDTATGIVADENEWTTAGPRIITPRKTVSGTVIGVFVARSAVIVRTDKAETYCVRVDR